MQSKIRKASPSPFCKADHSNLPFTFDLLVRLMRPSLKYIERTAKKVARKTQY
jgi:hypothetical protein